MIIVFTGNGKGKTTAALGQAFRTLGRGKRVLMIQFIKGPWKSGEDELVGRFKAQKALFKEDDQELLEGLENFYDFHIKKMGRGFVGILGDTLPKEEHARAAREALEYFRKENASGSHFSEKSIESSKEFILSLEGEERKLALIRMIQEKVAKVLGIAASALSTDQALNTMGLDSLMAIEMKNDIEANLKTNLPMLFLLKGPNIIQLVEYLIAQMTNVALSEKASSEMSSAPLVH